MIKFKLTKKLDSSSQNVFEILSDYNNYEKFFSYIKKCKIIDQKENEITTEETLFMGSNSFELKQSSLHVINTNNIVTKILTGPLKGSRLSYFFNENNSKTELIVNVELRVGLRYRLFSYILTKKYKLYLSKSLDYVSDISALTEKISWKNSLSDNGDCITISKNKLNNLKLFGWWKSDMHEVFNHEIYKFLPVEDKIVVDVGANICDSSIYFSQMKAKKILAIEPYIKNFNIGEKNILINNLSEKIELIQSACSDKIKKIRLDFEKEGTGLHLNESKTGSEIQSVTLEKIVTDYNLSSAVLKMDCEGCEYESILSSSNKTLCCFSHMLIEYHHGFTKLKEKLEECNFRVDVTQSGITSTKNYGYLFCTKIK